VCRPAERGCHRAAAQQLQRECERAPGRAHRTMRRCPAPSTSSLLLCHAFNCMATLLWSCCAAPGRTSRWPATAATPCALPGWCGRVTQLLLRCSDSGNRWPARAGRNLHVLVSD
jgi:hypothetical protein